MKYLTFYKSIIFIVFFFSIGTDYSLAQSQDKDSSSTKKKTEFKNTVRINLTNPMIFGNQCYMFGYERVVGQHQTFSFNIGRFSMPQAISLDLDSLKDATRSVKSKGFSFSGDYRFYLAKENKFNAPHGVYIGPYVTYNSFTRNFDLNANTQSFVGNVNAELSFTVVSAGFQLGYQFIFWKRVSLDMILFGPGVAAYKIKAEIGNNLSPEQDLELFQKINQKLQEKIPGYSLGINSTNFEKSGSVNSTGAGFRYVVMLGFRF